MTEIRIGIDQYSLDLGALWRPIDEDAKSGRRYLVGWFELEGQTGMAVAFWHSTRKAWVGSVAYSQQPTHYMVLPAPPWSLQATK